MPHRVSQQRLDTETNLRSTLACGSPPVEETMLLATPPAQTAFMHRIAVLGVRLGEVGAAGDGWTISKCGVGPMVVIPVQPGAEGGPAGSFCGIEPPKAQPSTKVRLNRSTLRLVWGAVGAGAFGRDGQLLAGVAPELAAVAAAVVGEHPGDDHPGGRRTRPGPAVGTPLRSHESHRGRSRHRPAGSGHRPRRG
jgi:hypothetical protein